MRTAILIGCLASCAVSERVQAQNSQATPPQAESTPLVPSEPYVLACVRGNPVVMERSMTPDDMAQRDAYRAGLRQVAADMVRLPDPALARPLIDGETVVLEAVAWDRSISRARPANFDINLYKPGTPQVCRRGYTEIGKFPVRQR